MRFGGNNLSLRNIVIVSVPSVAVILGYIWYHRRKKKPDYQSIKSIPKKQLNCVNTSSNNRNQQVQLSATLEQENDTIDALINSKKPLESFDECDSSNSCNLSDSSVQQTSNCDEIQVLLDNVQLNKNSISPDSVSNSIKSSLNNSLNSSQTQDEGSAIETVNSDPLSSPNKEVADESKSTCPEEIVPENISPPQASPSFSFSNVVDSSFDTHLEQLSTSLNQEPELDHCSEDQITTHEQKTTNNSLTVVEDIVKDDSLKSDLAKVIENGTNSDNDSQNAVEETLIESSLTNYNLLAEPEIPSINHKLVNHLNSQVTDLIVQESHEREVNNSNSNVFSKFSSLDEDQRPGTLSDNYSTNGECLNQECLSDNYIPSNKVDNSTNLFTHQFDFPSELCGRLIGRNGKNINHIKDKSGAEILLKKLPFTSEIQICHVEGSEKQVNKALYLIQRKFPEVDTESVSSNATNRPILNPSLMQLTLPEGYIDIMVSAVVDASHLFIQQTTHPTFSSLELLGKYMLECYSDPNNIIPQLPRPLEVGVICAAPMYHSWYRAQVVNVLEETDECEIKFVDYGGYLQVNICELRQIRSDFTTLPFQAIECYLSNIVPLQGSDKFSEEARVVLNELVQNKPTILQAQVVGYDENVPCIQLYSILNDSTVLINRELVNRGVAEWYE